MVANNGEEFHFIIFQKIPEESNLCRIGFTKLKLRSVGTLSFFQSRKSKIYSFSNPIQILKLLHFQIHKLINALPTNYFLRQLRPIKERWFYTRIPFQF